MDNAEHGIAITDILHNNAHRKQIINLVKLFILLDHLAVNAVDVLWTAGDFRFYINFPCFLKQGLNYVLNIFLAFCPLFLHEIYNSIILLRIDIPQTGILHLPLDGCDSKTVGKRGKNLKRFIGNLPLLLFR